MTEMNKQGSQETDSSVVLLEKFKGSFGSKYKVIFFNDNKTSFEFVIEMLKQVFKMSAKQAADKAMEVHEKGSAVVGKYSKEIALTKVQLVLSTAQSYGYPLQCTAEKE